MLTSGICKSGKLILLVILSVCIMAISMFTWSCCCSSPAEVAKKTCIELMKKVPAKYQNFEFWDAGTLRDNSDLAAIYEVWLERRGGRDIISGVDFEYWASGGVLTMITGDLSLRDIRNNLSKDYYHDPGYTDSEIWTLKPERDNRGLIDAFVLEDGLLVGGNSHNIEEYLSVANEDELSFYNDCIADIIKRLPPGIMIRAVITRVTGLDSITAMTVEREETGIYRWTNVTRFLDIDDIAGHLVELYVESIENDFRRAEEIYSERSESSPFREFTIERNGQDVTWSVLVDEDAMIALLFYG
jgi:hypothetical protein